MKKTTMTLTTPTMTAPSVLPPRLEREIKITLTCPSEWLEDDTLNSLWHSYTSLLRGWLNNYLTNYVCRVCEVDAYQPGLSFDCYTLCVRDLQGVTDEEITKDLRWLMHVTPQGVTYDISIDRYPHEQWRDEY